MISKMHGSYKFINFSIIFSQWQLSAHTDILIDITVIPHPSLHSRYSCGRIRSISHSVKTNSYRIVMKQQNRRAVSRKTGARKCISSTTCTSIELPQRYCSNWKGNSIYWISRATAVREYVLTVVIVTKRNSWTLSITPPVSCKHRKPETNQQI
jgi:hypothetical protein